tara:strand:- start:112 stop:240 length:129 start_codon:yes stop_codon:yes gene_type:complete
MGGATDEFIDVVTTNSFCFKKISILEYQIYPYPIYGFKGADF